MKPKDIFLGIIIAMSFNSVAQNFSWVKKAGSTGWDAGYSNVSDASDNIYTTGLFSGVVDFDPGPAAFTFSSVSSSTDIFISKLDSLGNFKWAKQIGSTGCNQICTGIALDASGNVYITGHFTGLGNEDFDPGPGTYTLASNGGSWDAFVLKLDALGNFIWAKQMGGPGSEYSSAIAIDFAGNVLTAGYFQNTAVFDPGPGTYTFSSVVGSADIFVSKLDGNGNFVWAKTAGDQGYDAAYSITTDKYGNVYSTGSFHASTIDFDPGPGVFNLSGQNDIFIQKLDAAGNFVWAKSFTGANADRGLDIVVDKFSNVYSTGYFEITTDFDPGPGTYTLNSTGIHDLYVSKLDINGDFIWAKSFTTTNVTEGDCIALDSMSNIYLTGLFQGTADFDPGAATYTLASNGVAQDVFISKLDVNGSFIWAKRFGGSSGDYAFSLATNATGSSIYTTGYFMNSVDFDPGPGSYVLTSAGVQDMYIHKLGYCSTPNMPTNVTTPSNQVICSSNNATLNATSTDPVYWYSSPTSTSSVGTGSAYVTPFLITGASPTTYTYFAEAKSSCTVSLRNPITVTVNPRPTITLTPSSSLICSGQSVTLTANGAGTYTWSTAQTGSVIVASPTVATNYTATGTNIYGCTDVKSSLINVSPCTQIIEIISTSNISIYPNPNNGSFNLQLDSEIENGELILFNVIGQKVFSQKIKQGDNEIKTQGLAKGLYHYSIVQNKQRIQKGKILIE